MTTRKTSTTRPRPSSRGQSSPDGVTQPAGYTPKGAAEILDGARAAEEGEGVETAHNTPAPPPPLWITEHVQVTPPPFQATTEAFGRLNEATREATAHMEELGARAPEPGLTRSQIRAAVGATVAMLATVDATTLNLLAAVLPPRWADGVRLVAALAGLYLATYNQSLNTNHISIPKARIQGLKWQDAARIGIGLGKTVAPGGVGKGLDIASEILGGAPQSDARVEQLIEVAKSHEQRLRLVEAKTGLK